MLFFIYLLKCQLYNTAATVDL